MATTSDPTLSVHREKALEHVFLGELSRRLLIAAGQGPEILRAEHDSHGYDVVLELGGVLRHVQFKLMTRGGRRASVNVNVALARKPGGCVLWMEVDESTYELGPFHWFGGRPGQPLPPLGDKPVWHTKANAQGEKAVRPNLRSIGRSRFTRLETIEEVITALFGDAHGRALRAHLINRSDEPLPADPPWLSAVRAGQFAAVPLELDWEGSVSFAHLIDGYRIVEDLGLGDPLEFAAARRLEAETTGVWRGSAAELWASLFLEHRRLGVGEGDASADDRIQIGRLQNILGTTLRAL